MQPARPLLILLHIVTYRTDTQYAVKVLYCTPHRPHLTAPHVQYFVHARYTIRDRDEEKQPAQYPVSLLIGHMPRICRPQIVTPSSLLRATRPSVTVSTLSRSREGSMVCFLSQVTLLFKTAFGDAMPRHPKPHTMRRSATRATRVSILTFNSNTILRRKRKRTEFSKVPPPHQS
ncbi:uncharacterized protein BDZ83DRAFT_262314 [Colletotrichum acutatum]|uniref:Uncharacterized protein n=1 Tax=Glomerella acutata TaxID=27357 RepID=A0AAD8UQA2_GLOAC|nr:uncharacterized protein BDZ83DRAFT_262314 [Colletotrichum acutatum]KAK1726320.1 hypothetical protein BDZ83DRAFT_262314 [Colletotrichum acutatum]